MLIKLNLCKQSGEVLLLEILKDLPLFAWKMGSIALPKHRCVVSL